ncbi:hypothetical protein EAE96_006650 [Botrytis aclada]|nr:hypothetical protein EAE96_006650 [Botrytis aclada]
MSGSGDSPPINHQGLPQGLGITSNQTSGRATPMDSLVGNDSGSRVNDPRVGAGQQRQQQEDANNPNFGLGSILTQQQMGINMLQQRRIQQQQAQNLQRQYHQTEQHRSQQQLQQQQYTAQQQYAAQQQMQRNQAQQQRLQQQHVGQSQAFQPAHILSEDILSPSPTATRLNGGQIEPAFQQLFSLPPTQFSMKNGRTNTFAPAAPTSAQPQVSGQQQEQKEAEEEAGFESACLYLSIKSPLTITGDDNVITFHPAPQVQKITDAVLQSLKSASEGSRGIPMADADGIPRAFKFDIDAAVTINGKHNILGEEAVKIWGQKVKGEALAAQTQAQRSLAQTQIKYQATAQAQGQAQGQVPKHEISNVDLGLHRKAKEIFDTMEAQYKAREALDTQRQIQNGMGAQEQEFPSPQEPIQVNGGGFEDARGHTHPHWIMQPQASILQQQQQPKSQEGRTKPQMGVFPAGPSKDFGKRARDSSSTQHDEEANKKTKTDM